MGAIEWTAVAVAAVAAGLVARQLFPRKRHYLAQVFDVNDSAQDIAFYLDNGFSFVGMVSLGDGRVLCIMRSRT
jgi:hypothetical protein